MATSNDVDAGAAPELRQRQPHRPAEGNQETPSTVSEPNDASEKRNDVDAVPKKTYGRTPDGTGKLVLQLTLYRP